MIHIIIFKFKLKLAVIRLLAAWWRVCDFNVLNLSLLHRSQLIVSSFRSYIRSQDHKKHNLKRRKRSVEWFNLSVELRLSALTSCARHQAARGSPRWGPPDLKFWAVAGLHVTSQQPCWWSRTKAFLSSGNLTPFSCKFFQKNFYCIDYQHTTNMAPLSRGCKPRILDENFIGLESYLEAEILMRGLPLYNLFVGEKKKKTVILEWTSPISLYFFYPQ